MGFPGQGDGMPDIWAGWWYDQQLVGLLSAFRYRQYRSRPAAFRQPLPPGQTSWCCGSRPKWLQPNQLWLAQILPPPPSSERPGWGGDAPQGYRDAQSTSFLHRPIGVPCFLCSRRHPTRHSAAPEPRPLAVIPSPQSPYRPLPSSGSAPHRAPGRRPPATPPPAAAAPPPHGARHPGRRRRLPRCGSRHFCPEPAVWHPGARGGGGGAGGPAHGGAQACVRGER